MTLKDMAAKWRQLQTPGRGANRHQAANDADRGAIPILRSADAHPDAPARRPIRAALDFGQPLPIAPTLQAVPTEQPLPADLDAPLAAYDAAAIPDAPREPVRPVEPLACVAPTKDEPADAASAGEPLPPTPDPRGLPIPVLLDRLESAAGRRREPARSSLEETLATLRAHATREVSRRSA